MARQSKVYEINGYKYKSKSLKEYHIYLTFYLKKGIIKSFALPTIDQEKYSGRYRSKKATIDGIVFDSLVESRFYVLLKENKLQKKIKSFEMQKEYILQPAFKKNGKSIRKISYIADFVIINNDNTIDVIDVKGVQTEVFKLKKKMFEYVYPELSLLCYQYSEADSKWYTLDELKKNKRAKKKAAQL